MLIDGDNTPAKYCEYIINKVAKYGRISIKRVYGNWTSPQMITWKELLKEYSMKGVYVSKKTKGKNAADIELTIDAMEILNEQKVQAFCIVSSDSDFTALVTKIKEKSLFVIGVGRKQTSTSLTKACDEFIFIEDQNQNTSNTVIYLLKKAHKKGLELIKGKNKLLNKKDRVPLSIIGAVLKNIAPQFKPKMHGFRNMSSLIKAYPNIFQVIDNNGSILVQEKK